MRDTITESDWRARGHYGYNGCGMFDKLKKLFRRRTAVRKAQDNPVLHAIVQCASEIYGRIPLGDLIDEAASNDLSRDLFLEIHDICNAAEPVTACRDKLVPTMLNFAALQVLMILPAPEEDPSDLRSLPGVTGELQSHLVDLFEKDADLRSLLPCSAEEATADNLLRALEQAYWRTYWYLETFNIARLEYEDKNEKHDWYRPFMHAACANQEHVYRIRLNLPPAFEEEKARDLATAYSIYTDIVVSGAEDPDQEWREYCSGSGLVIPRTYAQEAEGFLRGTAGR